MYCSDACKQNAYRYRHAQNDEDAILRYLKHLPPAPPEPARVTVDEMAKVVTQAKGCATAMHAYAPRCPEVMRSHLESFAAGIDEAARRAGL